MENATNNVSAQTNASGALWSAFQDVGCNAVRIHNNTGTPIEVRRFGGGTIFIPIQDKDKLTIFGVKSANQLEIRRIDQSNTQVTAVGEALTFG